MNKTRPTHAATVSSRIVAFALLALISTGGAFSASINSSSSKQHRRSPTEESEASEAAAQPAAPSSSLINIIAAADPAVVIVSSTAKTVLLGGYSAADVNDETVKEMASFATATVSQALNSAQPLTVVRIVSAETQVVAGFNYKMEIELKEDGGDKPDAIKCSVVVYDQSWTNTRRVTKCTCCGESWTSVDNRPILISIQPPTVSALVSRQQTADAAVDLPEAFMALSKDELPPPRPTSLQVTGEYVNVPVADYDDKRIVKIAEIIGAGILERLVAGSTLTGVKIRSASMQKQQPAKPNEKTTVIKYQMNLEINGAPSTFIGPRQLFCDVLVLDDDAEKDEPHLLQDVCKPEVIIPLPVVE